MEAFSSGLGASRVTQTKRVWASHWGSAFPSCLSSSLWTEVVMRVPGEQVNQKNPHALLQQWKIEQDCYYPRSLLLPSWCSCVSLWPSFIILIITASHTESCHWRRIGRFYQTLMFERFRAFIYHELLFLNNKGRCCKQREEHWASHFIIRGGRARFTPFSGPYPLNTWSRGVLLPSETNFTWQRETSVRSARACWFLRNVPNENGGVSILSGSLCRANFQPLSQKGLGDTEEGGGLLTWA